jgi:ABC-2 type transport system permease protein
MKGAWAIARRDFLRWFTNPAGYIFITLFIVLCSLGQFMVQKFFDQNLATLGTLNEFFPIIMVLFAAAMAMGTWADERRHGTDELLLTLPVTEGALVMGKYLGALAVYAVSLAFTITLVLCLEVLGNPDYGLVFSTYLGYALLGAALIPVAMIGSLLVDSVVIGFVLGIVFCAIPVVPGYLEDTFGETASSFGVHPYFRDLATGVVSFKAVAYFAALAALGIGINLAYWRWKRMRAGQWHLPVRIACVLVAAVSIVILGGRSGVRIDTTQERLHSLSKITIDTIDSISADRPVFITAYVSDQVPDSYVETRENLLALLRGIDARGRGRIHVQIHPTAKATETAKDAEERFKIRPVKLPTREGRGGRSMDVFLGAAITGGLDEVVVPFFYKGVSPEYEVTRSLRVVSKATRGRIGVVANDAKWFGGFEFQTMQSQPAWEIVEELKRQYEVVSVSVDAPITEPVDVLIAPMPSSLTQPQLDHLTEYAKQGKPILLIDDPLPIDNPSLGANEMKGGRRGMMMQQQPPEQKGNFREFYRLLGIAWDPNDVAWDTYKPAEFGDYPPELAFIEKGGGAAEPFSTKSSITNGLQQVVFLFAGSVRNGGLKGIEYTPLVTAGKSSGILSYSDVWQSNPFFGGGTIRPNRRHIPTAGLEGPVLAAKFQGKSGDVSVDAIFIADLDLIGGQFFQLRRMGMEHLSFDNVTFVLNAVDSLMRDEATIALRTRRPRHRTLTLLDNMKHDYDRKALEGAQSAQAAADKALADAQKRLDEEVQKIEQQTEIDVRTKEIKAEAVREAEQRKFDLEKRRIETEKEAAVDRTAAERAGSVKAVENGVRAQAIGGAILPAIVAAIIAFFLGVRRQMEVRR